VVDAEGSVAAYGIFWFDPVTRTGFVEPMGTDETHRRRGLAKHVLTAGLILLRELGATRIRVNYEIDNEASTALYLGIGFVPSMTTAMWYRGEPS
jgi:RimJ/RimL family protein N-acetyltransferase